MGRTTLPYQCQWKAVIHCASCLLPSTRFGLRVRNYRGDPAERPGTAPVCLRRAFARASPILQVIEELPGGRVARRQCPPSSLQVLGDTRSSFAIGLLRRFGQVSQGAASSRVSE
ncbi:hypothetical protein LIA77_03842 [Sarocladium implicatum]|nr:hypothetical protein LIA77_03842 [Sarocladium implicatum]